MAFIRSILEKITGFNKNKYPVPHIDGAELVVVDSSVLCCPVCYNVYGTVPLILSCGHTFCEGCVRNIASRNHLTERVNNELYFCCPMCRERCPARKLVKNYIIEDILSKIGDLPSSEKAKESVRTATLRLSKQRLETKCQELSQSVNRYKRIAEEQKKREIRNYGIFAVSFILYIFLAKFLGLSR